MSCVFLQFSSHVLHTLKSRSATSQRSSPDSAAQGTSQSVAIRGAGGDELVGVPSIFGSGARARVKSFIFYFFHHGHAPHHSKKNKKEPGPIRVRARTPRSRLRPCSSHHQWRFYLLCEAHPPSLAYHPSPSQPASQPASQPCIPTLG